MVVFNRIYAGFFGGFGESAPILCAIMNEIIAASARGKSGINCLLSDVTFQEEFSVGMEFVENIKKFIDQNKRFLFLLAGVCLLSYGFSITHYALGIDNTNTEFYMDQMGLIAQGRMTAPLLDKILFPLGTIPFWSLSIGIILLYCAVVVWTMLFSKIAKGKLSQAALITFGTVMVSFPIINETLIYGHICFNANFLINALALYFTYNLFEKFSYRKAILPVILMVFSVSYNESFCAVYLMGIFMTLIIRFLTNKSERLTIKKAFW